MGFHSPHHQDDRAEVHRLVVGRLDTNVWILRCRRTGEAVLFDAAAEPDLLLERAGALGVGGVLQTHGHWDHVGAIPALRQAGYPVRISAADVALIPNAARLDLDTTLADGEVIAVGDLRLQVLATPGHTPGSMCFRLDGAPLVFAGDTLFPGGPGATGGDPARFATILEAIESRLFSLAGETLVLPGHGELTTIGAERPHLAEWADRGW
ncbi:MAG: MBL fold metallo-hydrolase [Actinomycetota bacterium]|nr:MBL fold metallo-hydrolase [Actinomycetota bacterium]